MIAINSTTNLNNIEKKVEDADQVNASNPVNWGCRTHDGKQLNNLLEQHQIKSQESYILTIR